MSIFLFFRSFMAGYMYENRSYIIKEMIKTYGDENDEERYEIYFEGGELISLIMGCAVSIFGFYSLITNRLTTMKYFDYLMIINLVFGLLLCYVSTFYILLVISNIIVLNYIKYVKKLLINVLTTDYSDNN